MTPPADDGTWTVRRVLGWIEGYLAQHGDGNARVSAQWLVAEALDVSRMQLFVDPERPLSADERATLRGWTRRRGAGEPLQYITGATAFRHITVKVRPGVLIPRPETEVLVSEALALLPAARKPQDDFDDEAIRQLGELGGELGGPMGAGGGATHAKPPAGCASPTPAAGAAPENRAVSRGRRLLVADVCTGSGCIACSVAAEHPQAHVIATDLSPDAVALARENADALGLGERVEVVECDLGGGIDPALMGAFDLVVSNPPYVPTAVLETLPHEVGGYEPALALDGGADGLDVFRRLLAWCASALKPEGAFAFELHETRLGAAAEEAGAAGFADIRIARDLAGRPRVLTARKHASPASP